MRRRGGGGSRVWVGGYGFFYGVGPFRGMGSEGGESGEGRLSNDTSDDKKCDFGAIL